MSKPNLNLTKTVSLIIGVLDLFPDVQEEYLAELVQQNDLNAVCNLLLDNPSYPRREEAAAAAAVPSSLLAECGGPQSQWTDDVFDYSNGQQLIECGCCYGEFALEKITQCSDGHLFCKECLVKYAQEAVFGSGRSELSCMEGGCARSYPPRELEKVLPEKVLCKYYERQAEEAVAAVDCDELVRCPFCNFPALLDKGVPVFSCPDPKCRQESCRTCGVRWKQHAGKTCKQLQARSSTDETRIRVLYEERMTAARVRRCTTCHAALVKISGCNAVKCRCGTTMCYACRAPMRSCKCSGFVRDEDKRIQEIRKEGEALLNEKNRHGSNKRIGPPPEQNSEFTLCFLIYLFAVFAIIIFLSSYI